MSPRPSAKVIDMSVDIPEYEVDVEVMDNLPGVGSIITGDIYLVTHRCPFCYSSMQTLGVGHPVFNCSKCAAVRSRDIEMQRSFEHLEGVE
jgi:hypothetical protein